ncbi:MAG TPA: hypothetical protein VK887_05105, partial [Pseudonocardiaceae bacterium]|nr:hypothetical protein [Pseudonocardiaceae bacterium]
SRPDPATATARDLIELIERLEPEEWLADAGAWVAHRGAGPAAREIVGVLNDLLAALGAGDCGPDEQAALLSHFWCTEHPRVAELLEVISEHHPDKRVVKSARKALLRHRSFIASRR